jgi:tetratricopeptide (TPR) repeat protein
MGADRSGAASVHHKELGQTAAVRDKDYPSAVARPGGVFVAPIVVGQLPQAFGQKTKRIFCPASICARLNVIKSNATTMPRHKKTHVSPASNQPAGIKQTGLLAFRRNDFNAAILVWQKLDLETTPEARAALAEAHFHRALAARDDPTRLSDLHKAVELLPAEARYWYHLGLAHHRLYALDKAQAAYARAAELGFSRRAALAFARGLAAIEADPAVDLETLVWLTPEDRAALLPMTALLRSQPKLILDPHPGGWLDRLKTTFKDQAPAQFWRGLAYFAAGDLPQAQQTLAAISPAALPPEAEARRALYHGLALVHTGQAAAAMPIWLAALKRASTPTLQEALAVTGLRETQAALEAGNPAGALEAAVSALKSAPYHEDLRMAAAIARHRLAQTAVAQSQWAEALLHWNHMRDLLDLKPLTAWRLPVLRNLAVVHEHLEQWEAAAKAWADLMRALPRREPKPKKGKTQAVETPLTGLALAEQRRWLRRRILDNYQRAGRPDAAILYYKQAVKASPDDLDLRLELASALLSNQQEVAARNELTRILERDPKHLEARVRLAEIQQLRGELSAAEQSLRGHAWSNAGHLAEARNVYAEALALAPGDVDLLASLGFVELELKDEAAARVHFETALARNEPGAYLEVFRRWAGHDKLEEARQVLARAEQALPLSAHFYVDAASACFSQTIPELDKGPLGMFGPPPVSRKDKVRSKRWEAVGRELLAKATATATASSGNQTEVLRRIISEVTTPLPALALEYAQKLAALAPDDPANLTVLAFLQLINGQSGQSKETLRKVTRLARKLGDPALLAEIQQLRQMVDNPMLGLLGPMLPALLGSMEEDEEFFL